MASLMSPPYMDVGAGLTPADGAKLYFYVVGSATPKDSYTTAAATVAHANPLIADAKGVFPAIYLSGDYDWVLQDKNSVQRNTGSVSEFATASNSVFDKNFATLALAKADHNIISGDAVNLKERTTGNGGGGMWDVIAGTGTANGVDIVAHDTLDLSLVLRINGAVYPLPLGAVSDGVTNAIAVLDRMVILAQTYSLPIDLQSGNFYVSALWHVNEKVSVYGNNATLTGGDADGVMWWGYRTGANQNVYYIDLKVKDIKCVATTTGGVGFTSSKSINCEFKNILGDDSVGDGIRIRAAVGCKLDSVRCTSAGFNGVVFTYFTNADGITHVPTTACTIDNYNSEYNGTDAGADASNSFGILCDKDPDGNRAAYGNIFVGGFVQFNKFTGIRDFGDNTWESPWIEANGQDAGAADQYNFWDSGPKGSIIKSGRSQGAGVKRKLFVDGAVDRPTTKNVKFVGTLQTDIEYETTISGSHTGSSGAAILTDTTKAWGVDALVGKTITNTTDSSTATITSNTQQTITGTLSGGTDNDWDASDAYTIADAAPTNIIQEGNDYSGSSPEITPSAYDQRSAIIGTVRQNEFIATLTDVMFEYELAANSTGSAIFTSIGQLTNNTQTAVFSIAVHIDGAPPTLLGQIVQKSAEVTGSNQYVRFTTAYNERYSATTTDSATADLPIIRITAAGDVQYKQNNGSSAQKIQGTFTKKI